LTAKKLEQFGVAYEAVRIDEYPEARETVAGLGYSSAPVVVVDLGDGASWSWSGYRPSELEKLTALA
jgi:glutaredoxin-like protein NrdH